MKAYSAWDNGYTYRRVMAVDRSKVSNTNQNNFPVLFSTTMASLKTVGNGGRVQSANGYDIVFSTLPAGLQTGGALNLKVDTEAWNSLTGSVTFWIQVPSVTVLTNATFYMFYGNSAITTPQNFSTAAWDTNFKGIWHLGNGTNLSAKDDSGNGLNGTITASTATAGKIDGAAHFNGTSALIDVSTTAEGTATLTISGWINRYQPGRQYDVFATHGNGTSNGWTLVFNDVNNRVSFGHNSLNHFSDDIWVSGMTHFALIYDDAANSLKFYRNGVEAAFSDTDSIAAYGPTFKMGTDGSFFFLGTMEEVRISNVVRSADWIITEYNNQNSPQTFVLIGNEVETPPTVLRGGTYMNGVYR